ncbi:NUDIX hydrolase [Agromyces humi]|uniref:NUDIX hydrolase n=1 Tax=Agromyces humi TaxID=1766800 RepID=UPI0013595AEF|nr:NUDIX hydrolase [Agromyces humi]
MSTGSEFTPRGDRETRFENGKVRLDETPVVRPDGSEGFITTVHAGTGFGVVAIPRTVGRGMNFYGLVRQHRPVTNDYSLEFPRGWAADLSAAEAERELVEEINCEVLPNPVRIGQFRPEPGLLDTNVAVWLFETNPGEDLLYREEKSGATHLWVNDSTLTSLVTSGTITCGITLAAWALLLASGRHLS